MQVLLDFLFPSMKLFATDEFPWPQQIGALPCAKRGPKIGVELDMINAAIRIIFYSRIFKETLLALP